MNYQVVYSGPLLFKVKINLEDIKSIKKLFIKNKKFSHNKNLASLIAHTYKINDLNSFYEVLAPYLNAFKIAYKQWYNKDARQVDIVQAWVNFMKAGEGNPPHIHNQCNFLQKDKVFEGVKKRLSNSGFIATMEPGITRSLLNLFCGFMAFTASRLAA